jgi:hypothetical protein
LYRQGFIFSKQIGELKVGAKLALPFNVHYQALKKLHEKAASSSAFTGGARQEPLVICLSGPSAQGKSALMYSVATELLKVKGIPKDIHGKPDISQEIYSRTVETEFWDGYKNQRITLFDDFLQIRDSESTPNPEIMELIRTGNLTKLPLHMAELSDKGATCFNSEIVICTSNQNVHEYFPKSIACKEALRRRFDVNVMVRARKEVCVSRDGGYYLDERKVREKFGCAFSTDVWEARRVCPVSGDDLGPWMSYSELIRMLLTAYEKKFQRGAALKGFLEELADKPLVEAQGWLDVFWKPGSASDYAQEPIDWVWMRPVFEDPSVVRTLSSMQIAGLCSEAHKLTGIFHEEIVVKMWESPSRLVKSGENWKTMIFTHVSNGKQVFCDDASAVYADIARNDPLFVLSTRCIVQSLERRECVSSLWLPGLKSALAEWRKVVVSCVSQAKQIILDHPIICASIAFIPAIWFVIYRFFWCESTPLFDALHTGAALSTARVKHRHLCCKCAKIFEHAHVIGDVVESALILPVCGTCKRQGQKAEFDFSDSTVMISDRSDIVEKKPLCALFSEHQLIDLQSVERDDVKKHIQLTTSGDTVSGKKGVVRVQLVSSGDGRTARPVNVRVQSSRSNAEAQMRLDPGAHEVSHAIRSNMYTIFVGDGSAFPIAMRLCFIVGQIALTAGHLLPFLEKNTHIRITSATMREGMVFETKECVFQLVVDAKGEFKDQLLIQFPERMPLQRSLVKHLFSSKELGTKHFPCVLVNPQLDGMMVLKYGDALANDAPLVYQSIEGGKEHIYNLRRSYEYAIETTSGDCGSMMIGIGPHFMKKIAGMHVAGSPGRGYATPINVDDITRTLACFPVKAQISLELDGLLKTVDSEVRLPAGNFIPLGTPLYTLPRPTKTELKPSKIHGRVSVPTTKPSLLHPKFIGDDFVDPLMKGLSKAGAIPPSVDRDKLAACVNDVKSIVGCGNDSHRKRVLTNFEAVAGIDGDEFMNGIVRTTSPGYPLQPLAHGSVGKQKWLGRDEYKLDADVEREMERMIEAARNNVCIPAVWVDTLKDERRPIAKVDEGKTRVFSAGPMVYTLVFRKYFLGFSAHCAENRIDNEIAVGTNVYSVDWTRIAERMTSKGSRVIAGDFTNFDGTLVKDILMGVLDVIEEFYDGTDEDKQIRRVLWCSVVSSIHAFGDSVYMWTHSQPSGCPLTAIINSIYNSLSVRYVWMSIVSVEYANMKEFGRHVAMVSYGDDNIINISDVCSKFFNQITIAEGYKILGMTYTDEDKSGELVAFRSLSDISFLKRRFRKVEGSSLYRSPIAMDTILEMMNWVRGSSELLERTVENVETAMLELSLHDDDVFEEVSAKVRRACEDLSVRPKILTLHEYRTSALVALGALVAANKM